MVVATRKSTDRRQTDRGREAGDRRIPLTQLRRGATARICGDSGLDPCDRFLLETLGLAQDTCVRVCRASGSCILEVGVEQGQTSRIALAKSIASKVMVGPVDRPARPAEAPDSPGA